MNPQLSDKVRRIVAGVLQVSEEIVTDSSSPDTLEGWDSIQHLNMVLAFEQEFGLQFTPEEIEQMLSVELICMLVSEKLEKVGVLAYAS